MKMKCQIASLMLCPLLCGCLAIPSFEVHPIKEFRTVVVKNLETAEPIADAAVYSLLWPSGCSRHGCYYDQPPSMIIDRFPPEPNDVYDIYERAFSLSAARGEAIVEDNLSKLRTVNARGNVHYDYLADGQYTTFPRLSCNWLWLNLFPLGLQTGVAVDDVLVVSADGYRTVVYSPTNPLPTETHVKPEWDAIYVFLPCKEHAEYP